MLADAPQRHFNGLMVVGQNPGYEEDSSGHPFVGQSGQLLNYLLDRVGIRRSECVVTNACKCHSPKNREPRVEEIRTCRKWLHKEIARWQPKVILSLGGTAFQALTENEKVMDSMGRRFHLNPVADCDPVIVPTLHPAALLREWGLWEWVAQDVSLAGKLAHSDQPWQALPYCDMPDVEVLNVDSAGPRLKEITSGPFAYDIETTGLKYLTDRIACIGFCGQDLRPLVIPITGPECWPKLQTLVDWTQLRIVQNHKFDDKFIEHAGLRLGERIYDTMVASHLVDENTPHNLKDMMFRLLNTPDYEAEFRATLHSERDFTSGDTASLYRYCGYDTWGCYRIYKIMDEGLKREQLEWLFYNISMPLSRAIMEVEKTGVIWDRERRNVVFKEYEAAAQAAKEALQTSAQDQELNPGSVKQVAKVLFEKMGLDPVTFTPRDAPSTEALALQKLLLAMETRTNHHPSTESKKGLTPEKSMIGYRHENRAVSKGAQVRDSGSGVNHRLEDDDERKSFIKTLLNHRERAKAISNWLSAGKGFDLHVQGDGRIRPTYSLTRARTGRLACSEPGLHSVPKETSIRGIVKAAPGKTFVQLDMSQAELRVVAVAAEEKGLLEQFSRGIDAHTATASLLFGVPPEKVDNEQRAKGKTANFATIYLISPQGFADKNNMSLNEAKKFLGQVRKSMPAIERFSDFLWSFAQSYGYVPNAFGRKRRLTGLELYARSGTDKGYRIGELRRQAVNHFTQSTASDIASLATIRCAERMRDEHPTAQIVISHHDAIVVECLTSEAESIKNLLIEEFEKPTPQLKNAVIPVEVHISPRWGEKT